MLAKPNLNRFQVARPLGSSHSDVKKGQDGLRHGARLQADRFPLHRVPSGARELGNSAVAEDSFGLGGGGRGGRVVKEAHVL